MKHNDIETIDKLRTTDLANIFNVYEVSELGNFTLSYAINRTFNIKGLDNIHPKYYDRYVVKFRDTWLSIAYNYYGDARLWWVVCKMNNIIDPTIDPVDGVEIKLLKTKFVNEILNGLESAR